MAYNFNEQEIQEIRDNLKRITTHIPNDLAEWVWSTYKKLGGDGNQPCTCPSSAKLWRGALSTITDYMKSYDI